MPSGAKLGVAAAVVADALILVGGFNRDNAAGTDITGDVERFNILTKRCRTLSPEWYLAGDGGHDPVTAASFATENATECTISRVIILLVAKSSPH